MKSLDAYGVGVGMVAAHATLQASAAARHAGAQIPPAAKQAATQALHAAEQAVIHATQTRNPPSTGLTQKSRTMKIIRIITRAPAFCPFIVVAVAAVALTVVFDLAVSGLAVAITKNRKKNEKKF